jgi:hypothetical protein
MSKKPTWEENYDQWVEDFISKLSWSDRASDYEKTLVAGNIRHFASEAKQQLLQAAKAINKSKHEKRTLA